MNESLYDKFCDTMSNVSFYGKTLVISGTPVFAVYYYVYSVFGGARWSELLALVTFGHLLPPLALVHLMYVNQTVCSVAFLFAFWGLREECPGGNLNRLPTLWSMLWQKTVGIYLTQVSLYFAWPLMVAAGWGHTGWSFFALMIVVLIGLLVAICSVTQYYYLHPVAGYMNMFGIFYMMCALIFSLYWFVCRP